MQNNEEQKAPMSATEMLSKISGLLPETIQERFTWTTAAMQEFAQQEVSIAVHTELEKQLSITANANFQIKCLNKSVTEKDNEIEHLKLDVQMAHKEIDELKEVLLSTTESLGFYMNETKKAYIKLESITDSHVDTFFNWICNQSPDYTKTIKDQYEEFKLQQCK